MPRSASALPVLLLAACDQGTGHLHGAYLEVDDCRYVGHSVRFEPYELTLDHLTVNQTGGAIVMRLAPGEKLVDEVDQIAIALSEAFDLEKAAAAPGGHTLELRADGSGDAHLTLAPLGRCSHVSAALAAEGSLTFTAYGWRNGDRVAGTMAFDVVDRRTGEIKGRDFEGYFDFEDPDSLYAPKDY